MSKNEKNTYMTELTGEKLIFDEAGKVIGVQARYFDGTTYEIYGDTVILATGGFLGNHEMMMEVYGSDLNAMGDTVNDGTGIQMGLSAGGATYMLQTLPMVHISQVANLIRTDDLTADQKAVLSALALTTDMPMVTTGGESWGNTNQTGTEDDKVSVEIVFAPDFMYYEMYHDLETTDLFKQFEPSRFGSTGVEMVHGACDSVIDPRAAERFASRFRIPITFFENEGHSLSDHKGTPDRVADMAIAFYDAD